MSGRGRRGLGVLLGCLEVFWGFGLSVVFFRDGARLGWGMSNESYTAT